MNYDMTAMRTDAPKVPSRILLYGPGGEGKTSLACQFPSPVVLMCKQETGLLDLLSAGKLQDVPYFPELQNTDELKMYLGSLAAAEHDRKTVIIDAIGALETMTEQDVCTREFKNDWGERGYNSYGKGNKFVEKEFVLFLGMLDELWRRGMTVILIGHSQVATFKNPEGADFDHWTVNVRDKVFGHIEKWCGEVWFMNSTVSVNSKDEKAVGEATRMMFTRKRPQWDAKSRREMPDKIKLGTSAAESFAIIMKAAKDSCNAN